MWRKLAFYFLCGFLFEMALSLLSAILPEGWLSDEIHNFANISNFPIMVRIESAGFIGLLVGFIVVVSFWGFIVFLIMRLLRKACACFHLSRRQRLVLRYAMGFLILISLMWAFIITRNQSPIPFTTSPDIKSVVDGNTIFAIDLYQRLKDRPGNLFFSPYSISSGLAMTYAGARGETKTEIARTLHFDPTQTNLPEAFSALDARMRQIQRWYYITLSSANSLWGQKDHPFSDEYINLIHTQFGAEARPVDFIRAPAAVSAQINKWVRGKTKGNIEAIVGPDQFDQNSRLVLCNAIYFKGKWIQQFKVSETKPSDFTISSNQTLTVPMMRQKSKFKTARNNDFTLELLEMPYVGKDLSMIILLPAKTHFSEAGNEEPLTLADLERELTPDNLSNWLMVLDQSSPHETWVSLPRFTTTQSLDLKKELAAMGMGLAFADGADFSGMNRSTNLYLANVLHKAFVQVNESGTEAAAVTWMEAKTKSQSDRFIVDHPFIFLIRDNGSGNILFIGRIVDPTK